MKGNFFSIWLIVLLLVISCSPMGKEELSNPPYFKAMSQGSKWSATSATAYLYQADQKISVLGIKRDSKYFQEEQLVLQFKLSDIAVSNTLTKFNAEWRYVIGGDGVANSYEIDTTAQNFLRIKMLDQTARRILGTFSVQLVRNKFYHEPGILSFVQGEFDLTYDTLN